MTEHEMSEMDAWLEAIVRADDALDAHVSEITDDDVPLSVLVFAPFAPHVDRLPRDDAAAAWIVHEIEQHREQGSNA